MSEGTVHRPFAHDSAVGHVTGDALYIDDLPPVPGLLHLAFGLSEQAHARIAGMDLDAVRAAPGVVAVLTAADIPGENNIAPVLHDDPLLADGEVLYHGQPLFLVAADTREAARRAARLGRIDYEPLPALLTIAEARAAASVIEPAQMMRRGDAPAAIAAAPHRVTGAMTLGGQEHFYLESQAELEDRLEGIPA